MADPRSDSKLKAERGDEVACAGIRIESVDSERALPTMNCANMPRCRSRPLSTVCVRWPARPTRNHCTGAQPISLHA